uniref:Uncharacterized protein n=1 Tax=Acrobeloides nanus TaxID=290746 RepID=A0A914EPK2_9BILA
MFVRILWIVIITILCAVGIYFAYVTIKTYLSHPMDVVTALNYDTQNFPVVTVCNLNPYNYSVVQTNSAFSAINTLQTQYTTMVQNNYSNISPDTYGLNTVSTIYEKTERATETLVLLANSISVTQRTAAMFNYENFVRMCSYNGISCTESNFSTYTDATYGTCYQFNAPDTSDYMAFRSGSTFGLTILLLTQQFTFDNDTVPVILPTTNNAGARIGVGYKTEDPAMESHGINVPAGHEVLVGIELTKITRLKKPYSNCIDNDTTTSNLYPNNMYTLDTCMRSCIQRFIISKCGCADPRYGMPSGAKLCVQSDINCLRALRDHQNQNYTYYFDPLSSCNCLSPCAESDLDTTITMARFPAPTYSVLNGPETDLLFSCSAQCNSSSNQQACVDACNEWYANNSVVIRVYYDGLDYVEYDETPTFTLTTMFNNLGGQLGLWCATSVISFIEIAMLLGVLCAYGIYGRKHARINPNDDDFENDNRMKNVNALKNELDEHDYIDHQLRQRANAAK